jgi:hypothetical protein
MSNERACVKCMHRPLSRRHPSIIAVDAPSWKCLRTVCLPACLPICLPACLSTCQPALLCTSPPVVDRPPTAHTRTHARTHSPTPARIASHLRPCAHTDTASRLDEAAVLGLSAQAGVHAHNTRPRSAGASRLAASPLRDHDEERDGCPPRFHREQLELTLWRHDTAICATELSSRHPRDRQDSQGP